MKSPILDPEMAAGDGTREECCAAWLGRTYLGYHGGEKDFFTPTLMGISWEELEISGERIPWMTHSGRARVEEEISRTAEVAWIRWGILVHPGSGSGSPFGAFPSHGGIPSHHPFCLGFSMIQKPACNWGTMVPHGTMKTNGSPQATRFQSVGDLGWTWEAWTLIKERLQSMAWFKGKITGKPHDLNEKIDGFRLRKIKIFP